MEEEEEEQREGKSKGPDFRWEQRVAHAGARGRTKQNGIQGNIPYFHNQCLLCSIVLRRSSLLIVINASHLVFFSFLPSFFSIDGFDMVD